MKKLTVNELRVGNLVTYGTFNSLKVMEILSTFARVWIDNNQTDWISVGYDYIDPIPLTEELLLKFGFIKEFDDLYTKGVFNISADFEKINMIHSAYDLQIKFVHELQNLYFCLCGKELTIK